MNRPYGRGGKTPRPAPSDAPSGVCPVLQERRALGAFAVGGGTGDHKSRPYGKGWAPSPYRRIRCSARQSTEPTRTMTRTMMSLVSIGFAAPPWRLRKTMIAPASPANVALDPFGAAL